MTSNADSIHLVSVVIPVYQGESSLAAVVSELVEFSHDQVTTDGNSWRIAEVVLVHDHGPDQSDRVIRELALEHVIVTPVWLSRNSGQHAATLAGMASSGSEWIVTMDEDGQHDPRDIGVMLDVALSSRRPVVYGRPSVPPPHGAFRNVASRTAKKFVAWASGDASVTEYQSLRLITGEIGRSLAAYAGAGVYLDVALRWVAPMPAFALTARRVESGRRSGYSYSRLIGHFWRLFLSSGTRGLRLISLLGVVFALAGALLAVVVIVQRFVDGTLPEGWTSTIVILLLTSGATLFSLGVLVEYIGIVVNAAMGRPRYLIVSDPALGPLGRRARD